MRSVIGAILGGLWNYCRLSARATGYGTPALYLFLYYILLPVGLLLVLLGFDLEAVDRWLDGHAGWLDALGSLAFKALLAIVLLVSVLGVAAGLFGRLRALVRPAPTTTRRRGTDGAEADDLPGWGTVLLCLVLGYFAAASLFAP
jgi:hypothetical protein